MDAITDLMPCGLLRHGDDGIIGDVNVTFANWLGWSKEELIGKDIATLMRISGRIFYQTHLFPLLTLSGKAEEIFLTFISKNGAELPLLLNAKRTGEVGSLQNIVVAILVHQRKKYESELLQARKTAEDVLHKNELLQQTAAELEKSKIESDIQVSNLFRMNEDLLLFSKVISHDMQEPVRKIAIFADILNRDNSAAFSTDSAMALNRIQSAAIRLRELIICVQQYVSVDTVKDAPELCELGTLLIEGFNKAKIDLGNETAQLSAAPLPVVPGVSAQLRLLFYHLCHNAIRFAKAGAPVIISVHADTIQQNSYKATSGKYRYVDFARIVIADNGQGFNPDYTTYIFGLFKKANTEYPSLGYGLALCKKIVERHGGSITAHSAGEGMGAKFVVLLPI